MTVVIEGAGIAGTFLARELHRRGVAVRVRRMESRPPASAAAAGLVNPVTGLRASLAWRWEDFQPAALVAFASIASELGRPVWHPLPIDRIFRSEEERGHWMRRADDSAAAAFFLPLPESPVEAPWGGVRVVGGGWFDTACLPAVLPPEAGSRDEPASEGIVAECRGYPGGAGGWNLPWSAAKGETLTLRLNNWPEDRIVFVQGKFLIPLGGGLFRAGATYAWDDLEPVPTVAARELILGVLGCAGVEVAEVVDHRAGIRPVLRGRRPVLGPHPDDPRRWIFNGLASRGALWAPRLAVELADWMLEGRPASSEVDVRRFAAHPDQTG